MDKRLTQFKKAQEDFFKARVAWQKEVEALLLLFSEEEHHLRIFDEDEIDYFYVNGKLPVFDNGMIVVGCVNALETKYFVSNAVLRIDIPEEESEENPIAINVAATHYGVPKRRVI